MTSSLKGRLLVASPALSDPNFDRTVVLMVEHTDEGALGMVLNRPGDRLPGQPFEPWRSLIAPPAVLFIGGPVEPHAVISLAKVRHTSADDAWTPVSGSLGLLDASRHPQDVGQRVEQLRAFAGCAGWGPGQLESEVATGAWIVIDATPEDALSTQPLELWRSVLRRQGGRLALVSSFPDDPSLN